MPKKQKQFKYKCLEVMCHATIRHDKWLEHCKKKHAYKVKNKLDIKYKIIEFKCSGEDQWKPYINDNLQAESEKLQESIR